MNDLAWENIEKDRANPQPTPPIGERVQWYKEGDTRDPRAAIVTGIEESGRLKLVTFAPNAFPEHKMGVYHVSNKVHAIHNNMTTKRCGSWDYLPGTRVPSAHYDLFNETIQKRVNNLENQEQKQKALAAIKAAKEAEAAKDISGMDQRVEALKALVQRLVGSEPGSRVADNEAPTEEASQAEANQAPPKRLKSWQKLAKKLEDAEAEKAEQGSTPVLEKAPF